MTDSRGMSSPGTVMVLHHQASFKAVHLRPKPHRLVVSIAGIIEGARAPLVIGRLGQVLLAHLLVVLKAASRQHDTALRAWMRRGLPSRITSSPTTLPPSSTRLVIRVLSHRGMSRSSMDARRRATPAQPVARRRWNLLLEAPGNIQHVVQEQSLKMDFHQPGCWPTITAASTWVIPMTPARCIIWCVRRSCFHSGPTRWRRRFRVPWNDAPPFRPQGWCNNRDSARG